VEQCGRPYGFRHGQIASAKVGDHAVGRRNSFLVLVAYNFRNAGLEKPQVAAVGDKARALFHEPKRVRQLREVRPGRDAVSVGGVNQRAGRLANGLTLKS